MATLAYSHLRLADDGRDQLGFGPGSWPAWRYSFLESRWHRRLMTTLRRASSVWDPSWRDRGSGSGVCVRSSSVGAAGCRQVLGVARAADPTLDRTRVGLSPPVGAPSRSCGDLSTTARLPSRTRPLLAARSRGSSPQPPPLGWTIRGLVRSSTPPQLDVALNTPRPR